jgi:hypothetical protein
MKSGPSDSGISSDYSPSPADDGTEPGPSEAPASPAAQYLMVRVDQGLETIKDDVTDIKYKVSLDYRMIMSDISIGVASSLIVAVVILFVTTNLGRDAVSVWGLSLPVFVLFWFVVLFVGLAVSFITRKVVLRNRKPRGPDSP